MLAFDWGVHALTGHERGFVDHRVAGLEVSGYIVGQGAARRPPGGAFRGLSCSETHRNPRASIAHGSGESGRRPELLREAFDPEAVVTEDPVSGGPLVVPVGRAAR